MSTRGFRILGLQQIAMGALDKAKLEHLWCDLLGVEQVDHYSNESENVIENILRIGSGPNSVEVDLMQPMDPEKSPKVHIPALNHIGLWVDNLPVAVEYLSKKGIRFTPGGIRKGAGGHDVCFIHPKGNEASPLSGEGVLIELVQAPPDLE